MRIGIDFDNTIICYDRIFHAAAVARELIPEDTGHDKTAVRDYLRAAGNEDAWTELQGIVYGKDIDRAKPYPDVKRFILDRIAHGDDVFIVSHKTKFPYIGEPHNLHDAARNWLFNNNILVSTGDGLLETSAFFELTKEDKLARIAALSCDVFIDDLPEFLREPGFPKPTHRVLFDPEQRHEADDTLEIIHSWKDAISRAKTAWPHNAGS